MPKGWQAKSKRRTVVLFEARARQRRECHTVHTGCALREEHPCRTNEEAGCPSRDIARVPRTTTLETNLAWKGGMGVLRLKHEQAFLHNTQALNKIVHTFRSQAIVKSHLVPCVKKEGSS